jgi:hypothetical protein
MPLVKAEEIDMTIKESLDKLPTTTVGIAKALAAKGIKGKRKDSQSCPIAKYLKADGNPLAIVAIAGHIYAWEIGLEWLGLETELPPAVSSFVVAFDHGEYPELEET